jgi:ElaB/YqjD/DUF883 family membrane-anchored ribosome-binding protein
VDSELEVIRDEMEQTRANLADKLGALENQVRETVSGATEAVSSTVEGVKEVVENVTETVESVTETFNVSKHVEKHPWLALGAALAAGFVVAQILEGRSPPVPPSPEPYLPPQAQPRHVQSEAPREPGLLGSLESMIPNVKDLLPDAKDLLPDLKALLPDVKGAMNTAVSGLSGLAVGTLMGVVREIAAEAMPGQWGGELTKVVDQVTERLGGKVLPAEWKDELTKLVDQVTEHLGVKLPHPGQPEAPQQSQYVSEQPGVPFAPQKQQQPAQPASAQRKQPAGNGIQRDKPGSKPPSRL